MWGPGPHPRASGAQLSETGGQFLSVDTLKVFEILGFNFRQALGEPLTELTRKAILSRLAATSDAQLEVVRREQAYVHLAMDAEAYARFREMFPLS